MQPSNFLAFTQQAWGKNTRNWEVDNDAPDGVARATFDIDTDKMHITVERIGDAEPVEEVPEEPS